MLGRRLWTTSKNFLTANRTSNVISLQEKGRPCSASLSKPTSIGVRSNRNGGWHFLVELTEMRVTQLVTTGGFASRLLLQISGDSFRYSTRNYPHCREVSNTVVGQVRGTFVKHKRALW